MKRNGWKRGFALMLALFMSVWGAALAEAGAQADVFADCVEGLLDAFEERPAVPAEAAVVAEAVSVLEERAVEEAPAAEETPVADETPMAEETPVADGMPVADETPVVDGMPVAEETPVVDETPAPEQPANPDSGDCAHVHYSVHTRRQNLRAESLDAGHHSLNYTLVSVYTCKSCGLSWQETEDFADVTEPHNLEGGVCAECGYQADCTHENARVETQRRDVLYSDVNGSGHTCSYYAVTVHICPDCGAEWEDAWPQKRTSQRESHKFADGECTLCGYENSCAHENALARSVQYELSYEDADAEGHALSYYAVTAYECPDCGKYWEDAWPVERTRQWEAHCFSDGVCVLCGYENTCAHRHLSTYLAWRDPQYSDPDAGGHTLSYLAVSVTLCSDCTERWEEVSSTRTTVRQVHAYVDGVCQECGYPLSMAADTGRTDG